MERGLLPASGICTVYAVDPNNPVFAAGGLDRAVLLVEATGVPSLLSCPSLNGDRLDRAPASLTHRRVQVRPCIPRPGFERVEK